jgi:hypothetical protein
VSGGLCHIHEPGWALRKEGDSQVSPLHVARHVGKNTPAMEDKCAIYGPNGAVYLTGANVDPVGQ